ncbi:MAG: 7TM diverse intracellular signaling domain-containing protein, partial [Balneolaceae bacterium]
MTKIWCSAISFLVVMFGLLPAVAVAQLSVLQLQESLDGERITDRFSIAITDDYVEPGRVWQSMVDQPDPRKYQFGFTDKLHWAALSLQNTSNQERWVLEVQNPHINYLKVYTRSRTGDEWQLQTNTGRSTQFDSRDIDHFHFVIPVDLAQGESTDLLLMFDKRGSSLQYHTRIWTFDSFNNTQQVHYALFGVYFGVFLFMIIIVTAAFLFSFDRIYLWYGLYVLSVGLFVFNDLGLAQQYIYPFSDYIGARARVGLTYGMLLAFIQFTRLYFNTSHYYPVLNRLFKGVFWVVVFHAAVHILFTEWFRSNATPMLIILYAAILFAISLAVVVAFKFIETEKYTSLLFITAFSVLFLAGILFIMMEFGWFQDVRFLFTPVQFGSLFEILFLSMGMAWRVRVIDKQTTELQKRVAGLRNEKLMAYIEGTEKERNRVAMELHDSVGNRLARFRRMIEAGWEEVAHLKNELQEIIDDVRSLSHKLTPPPLMLANIEQSIEQLVADANQHSDISYQFYPLDVPSGLPAHCTQQLHRIVQEALQNIEKHSKATEAVV